MNGISPVNNVSFGAKLDISAITKNKGRWEKIANKFEQRTKDYPNDTLILSPNKRYAEIIKISDNATTSTPKILFDLNFYAYKLLNNANDTIVKSFKNILKFKTEKDDIAHNMEQIAQKLDLIGGQQRWSCYNCNSGMLKIFNRHTEEALSKDPVLNNAKTSLGINIID